MRRKITEVEQSDELPDLTAQQMRFVELLLSGKNASEAYRSSHDCSQTQAASVWALASRLRSDVKVQSWLSAARKAEIAHSNITLNQHIQRLEALKQRCEDNGNFGAAVQCEQLIGKAMGHYTEKLDVTVTDIADELRELAKVSPELAKAYADEKGVTWQ